MLVVVVTHDGIVETMEASDLIPFVKDIIRAPDGRDYLESVTLFQHGNYRVILNEEGSIEPFLPMNRRLPGVPGSAVVIRQEGPEWLGLEQREADLLREFLLSQPMMTEEEAEKLRDLSWAIYTLEE